MELLGGVFDGSVALVGGMATLGGAVLALWKFGVPDCRLEPADQGVDWMDRFGPGAVWPIKARLISRSGIARNVQVRLELVELRDHRERPLGRRGPLSVDLAPIWEAGTREVELLVPPCPREVFDEPRRLRVKGRLVGSRWAGLGIPRRFHFDMAQRGSHRGAMFERSSA